jgi:hypothetical protein
MSAVDAFFETDGPRYVATALTRGPWQIDHQHGGPPAALIARSMEALIAAEPGEWHTARFTVDFLRPLLVGPPMHVTSEVTRRGQKILGLAGTITADGRDLARASALCVRQRPVDLPAETSPAQHLVDVAALQVHTFPFFRWEVGYHTAVEGRHGERGSVWLRPRHPLVAGELLSPLQRTLIVADAINGVGFVLDLARFSFTNADLTVHLHRPPAGSWVQLAATHTPQPNGVGLVDAALADEHGSIGRAVETQVVAPIVARNG